MVLLDIDPQCCSTNPILLGHLAWVVDPDPAGSENICNLGSGSGREQKNRFHNAASGKVLVLLDMDPQYCSTHLYYLAIWHSFGASGYGSTILLHTPYIIRPSGKVLVLLDMDTHYALHALYY
jgi:hypothetical protein